MKGLTSGKPLHGLYWGNTRGKGMATHSNILFFFSTPVFVPGESHGQRSLTGYSPWGQKESHN